MTRSRALRRAALAALALAACLLVVRLVVGRAAPATDGLAGTARGGCPDTPNCVSTLATARAVRVAPLTCAAGVDAALGAVDRALPGRATRLGPDHWVVHSRVLGFPDDVHVAARDDGRVDVLSASRVGSDDLGVNRARVEALRDAVASDPTC